MTRTAPSHPAARRVGVVRFRGGIPESADGEVAIERPLTIRAEGETVSVTMRTPGHDRELVAGFLVAEGWVTRKDQILRLDHPPEGEPGAEDIIDVVARNAAAGRIAGAVRRGTLTSSACGVCGRTTLDDLFARCTPVDDPSPWSVGVVQGLTGLLAELQPGFARTGGLHAAALVARESLDALAFEDVGRHNAVDKVVGHALLEGTLPLRGRALVVSGRTSFEIVQKAIAAQVPLVVGVSAPSSLAVEMAERAGVTLVGFAREDRFEVYAGVERLI